MGGRILARYPRLLTAGLLLFSVLIIAHWGGWGAGGVHYTLIMPFDS